MIALAVASGGALGALARYVIHQYMIANGMTAVGLSTFAVNVSGSFAIGCCFVLFERFSVSEAMRLGLMVGFLGAFTTFSTFSLELVSELQAGNYLRPAVYAAAAVLFCVVACFAGIAVTRSVID